MKRFCCGVPVTEGTEMAWELAMGPGVVKDKNEGASLRQLRKYERRTDQLRQLSKISRTEH